MQARFILLLLLLFCAGLSFAQSSKKRKQKTDEDELQQQPNSIDPNYQQTENKQKKTKRSSVKPSRNPDQEFYERMAEIEKTRQKNERMMDKPQYSDPMYFGHKKPPKKHKPGKMKYCKVCGIRH